MAQDTLQVLLVEDTDADALRIGRFLEDARTKKYALTRARSLAEACTLLDSMAFDVLLVDLGLPDSRGLEAVKTIHAKVPHLPIVVQSRLDERNGEVAVRCGAQDFLPKGQFNAQLLSRSLQYAIERKEAERQLRVSEERYSLAVLGSHDGLWDWDLEKNIIYVSARWCEIMGLEAGESEFTPDRWLACIHPDDCAALLQVVHAHIEGLTEGLEHECRCRYPDGSHHWTLTRGRAVRDATGRASRLVGSVSDIDERKQAEFQLRFHALHDQLTGMANRTLLLERARHVIFRAQRNVALSFALLFIDVDRFKLINDSLGHSFGDKLLIAFSRRLMSLVRPADTVARISGDEFAILLEDQSGASSPGTVAQRIHAALQQRFVVDGREMYLSVSVGIAQGRTDQRPEELLRDADLAMYQAKKNGKSCFRICDDQMLLRAQKRMQLEIDMRTALERNEFFLEYQPIISLTGSELKGFEALVRWRHPTMDVVGPDDFISIADDTGLIVPLGHQILDMALKTLAEDWADSDVTVAVNLSPRQILHPGLVSNVEEALARNGVPSHRLCVEVTENVFIEHGGPASDVFDQLRRIGVRVHLDDFGTGYSSLSYLRHFPIDRVKIDRTFVAGVPQIEADNAVIRCIVALGRTLGFDVVAEGIENAKQFEVLRSFGCDLGQGFYCARPSAKPEWSEARGARLNVEGERSNNREDGVQDPEPT